MSVNFGMSCNFWLKFLAYVVRHIIRSKPEWDKQSMFFWVFWACSLGQTFRAFLISTRLELIKCATHILNNYLYSFLFYLRCVCGCLCVCVCGYHPSPHAIAIKGHLNEVWRIHFRLLLQSVSLVFSAQTQPRLRTRRLAIAMSVKSCVTCSECVPCSDVSHTLWWFVVVPVVRVFGGGGGGDGGGNDNGCTCCLDRSCRFCCPYRFC